MLKRFLVTSMAVVALAFATPAAADLTVFLGATTTPSNRLARGIAIGTGLLVVGFEFEYSDIREDSVEGAPSLRTGMANGVLQTPIPIAGLQFYATAGGGVYRERLLDVSETHFGVNVGGGVKISLLGPLRLRLDYRLFTLRGEPLYDRYHRFYAGANLGF